MDRADLMAHSQSAGKFRPLLEDSVNAYEAGDYRGG